MTPGPELDAAVLRILGYDLRKMVLCGATPDVAALFYDDVATGHEEAVDGSISTEPNGHEALRLCGPWLDERCEWSVSFYLMAELSDHRHVASAYDRNLNFFKVRCATRAEAICRLVLAVAEREGT